MRIRWQDSRKGKDLEWNNGNVGMELCLFFRDLKMFEDMFMFACPKFISPVPPDYDSLPENYNKVQGS